MPTFRDLFKAQREQPIVVDGRELHATYRLPVKDRNLLKFEFLRSLERPAQGLILTANRCHLEVGGAAALRVELWTNTAPKHVEFRVTRAKSNASIEIVNQWIDEKHGTLYHVNNAAMAVEQQADDSLLFRCSDGNGDANFDDLVFQLAVSG